MIISMIVFAGFFKKASGFRRSARKFGEYMQKVSSSWNFAEKIEGGDQNLAAPLLFFRFLRVR